MDCPECGRRPKYASEHNANFCEHCGIQIDGVRLTDGALYLVRSESNELFIARAEFYEGIGTDAWIGQYGRIRNMWFDDIWVNIGMFGPMAKNS